MVPALESLGACGDGCWLWPSITQNAYQTAEIVAYTFGIGRSKIVPEVGAPRAAELAHPANSAHSARGWRSIPCRFPYPTGRARPPQSDTCKGSTSD